MHLLKIQDARAQLAQVAIDGQQSRASPAACPFDLDELLTRDRADLEAKLGPGEVPGG